mmetsp:Transcript_10748/g.24534  ORF Transcript_10748/g.24534 Transcript_10748/m.24534 type:complete len:388 (-) Transcript_10748:59-1222(-)
MPARDDPKSSKAWTTRSLWGQETGVEFVDAAGDTNLLVIGAHGLDLYVNGRRSYEDFTEVKLSGEDSRTVLLDGGKATASSKPISGSRTPTSNRGSASKSTPPPAAVIKTTVREGEEEVVLRLLALGQKNPALDRDREVASVNFLDADGEQNLLCINRFGRIDLYSSGQRRGHDLLSARQEPQDGNRLILRPLSAKRDVVISATQDTVEKILALFQSRSADLDDVEEQQGYCSNFLESATGPEVKPANSQTSTAATESAPPAGEVLPLSILHDRLVEAGASRWRADQDEESGSPSSSFEDDAQSGRFPSEVQLTVAQLQAPGSVPDLPQPSIRKELEQAFVDITFTSSPFRRDPATASAAGTFLESSLVPASDVFQRGTWYSSPFQA